MGQISVLLLPSEGLEGLVLHSLIDECFSSGLLHLLQHWGECHLIFPKYLADIMEQCSEAEVYEHMHLFLCKVLRVKPPAFLYMCPSVACALPSSR